MEKGSGFRVVLKKFAGKGQIQDAQPFQAPCGPTDTLTHSPQGFSFCSSELNAKQSKADLLAAGRVGSCEASCGLGTLGL